MQTKNNIIESFTQGIQSGNFSLLNETLNDALENATGLTNTIAHGFKTMNKKASQVQQRKMIAEQKKKIMPMDRRFPGTRKAGAFLLIGVIGLIFCLATMGSIMLQLFQIGGTRLDYLTVLLQWTLPLVIFFYLLFRGLYLKRLNKNYSQIRKAFGNTPYASIKSLSRKVDLPEEKVLKIIKKAIDRHAFPKAVLTDDENYVALSESALPLLTAHISRSEQKKQLKEEQEKLESEYPALGESSKRVEHLIGVIDDAFDNEELRDNPAFLEQLKKLRTTLFNINSYIQKHPEKIPDLKSFLNYFVPTVEKLIKTYEKLDDQMLQTATIKESKAEIEDVLIDVNTAFRNLYDSFFKATAMDVSSDISVLQTLFAQKGMVANDFPEHTIHAS